MNSVSVASCLFAESLVFYFLILTPPLRAEGIIMNTTTTQKTDAADILLGGALLGIMLVLLALITVSVIKVAGL